MSRGRSHRVARGLAAIAAAVAARVEAARRQAPVLLITEHPTRPADLLGFLVERAP